MNSKRKIFLVYVIILLILNQRLATFTWQEVAYYVKWITAVKQSADIKVRHFLQMSPQAISLAFFLKSVLNKSTLMSTLFAFVLTVFFGILSEVTQIFSPTRIFAWSDIFWNTYASAYGCSLFILLIDIGSKIRTRSGNIAYYFNLFFFLSTTCFLFFQSLLFTPLDNDDYKIVMALRNPEGNSWDYLADILSSPTNHGVQYRPLSYYFSPILLGSFLPTTSYHFVLCAMLFLSSGAILFYSFLRTLNIRHFVSLYFTLLFMLGPWMVKMIVSFRDLFKYGFTLQLLIVGLLTVTSSLKIFLKIGIIILITTISIMCHEGAVVFPLVFLFFLKERMSLAQKMLFLSPSMIYLFMRIFVWGIPRKGFMALKISMIDDVVFHHLSTIGSFYFFRNYWLGALYLLLLSYYVKWRHRKGSNLPKKLFISLLIILFPFSLLDSHISKSHAVWPSLFIFLIISELTSTFINTQIKQQKKWISVVLLAIFFSVTIKSSALEKQRHYENAKRMETIYKNFSDYLDSQKLDKSLPIQVTIPASLRVDDHEMTVTAAALAYYYPTHTFVVSKDDSFNKVYTKNGFIYSFEDKGAQENEVVSKDIFKRIHKVSPPKVFNQRIEAPSMSGNFLEHYHIEGPDIPIFDSHAPPVVDRLF